MQTHVQRSVAGCFVVLRQLCSIRRDVPSSVYQSLVVSLVLSRLDYGNMTLAGLPACLLNRPQSVLNATARLIAGLRCSKHITHALASFHWLQTPERIKFELFTALHLSTCQTSYSTSLICPRDVEASCDRRPSVFSTSVHRGLSLMAIALLLLLARDSGTVYLLMSSLPHHSRHFARS